MRDEPDGCPAWGGEKARGLSARGRAAATLEGSREERLGGLLQRCKLVLVSPWARTERHTSTWGGTGGSASGSPSRSTRSHRSARASSVRTPTRRLNTT